MTTALNTVPEEFGPYIVYERLGLGGMATVHRAKKHGIEGFERSLALKRILPHLAEDPHFVESFIREAKVASLLVHPNIAQIYDFGRFGGIYYIAMELVAGFDLRKLLRYANRSGEPIPLPVVLSILAELCDALQYAHSFLDEHGQPLHIVHRDVSPSNLIVAHTGHLKVIDFGIAKANSRQLYTESGQVKGKLGYMSPEVAMGLPIGPVSDVFSTGVVAWELITAAPLFSSKSDFETMQRIREGEISPPSQRNPNCPAALDAVILAALERSPDSRLPDAGLFRLAIDDIAAAAGIQLSPRTVAEWILRFAQPDDVWARAVPSASGSGSGRHSQRIQVPSEAAVAANRPVARIGEVKLKRSADEAQLAAELWGDDLAPIAVAASGPNVRASIAPPAIAPLIAPAIASQAIAGVRSNAEPVISAPEPRSRAKTIAMGAALALAVGSGGAYAFSRWWSPTGSATGPVPTGSLRFAVQPEGSTIEINGRVVSRRAGYEATLEPGEYNITVHHDGFKPWSRSIKLSDGDQQSFPVVLERGVAHIVVDSRPRGLAIELDGNPTGYKTPAKFDAPAGGHEIKVVGVTGEVWSKQITADVDGRHDLFAGLTPEQPVAPAAVESPVATAVKAGTKPVRSRSPASRPGRERFAEPEPTQPVESPGPAVPPIEVAPPPAPPPAQPPVVAPVIPSPQVKPRADKPASRSPVGVPPSAVTKQSGDVPEIRVHSRDVNGEVLVKLCIDDHGSVTSTRFARAAPEIAAALEPALKTWRYKPYLNRDGQATPACFMLSFRVVVKAAD